MQLIRELHVSHIKSSAIVRRTIYGISRQLIDETIESINTRIADKIRNNGIRLKH